VVLYRLDLLRLDDDELPYLVGHLEDGLSRRGLEYNEILSYIHTIPRTDTYPNLLRNPESRWRRKAKGRLTPSSGRWIVQAFGGDLVGRAECIRI
jgi:hypothetical protein